MTDSYQMPDKVIVVTGMAGSGKSVALRALEDLGFHCVDNLPAQLLPQFLEACQKSQFHSKSIALALDARDRSMPAALISCWPKLNSMTSTEMLFLEASCDVLVTRFRETRRSHPLAQSHTEELHLNPTGLLDAIELDAEILEPVRQIATRVIDTSRMPSQTLRQLITHDYAPELENQLMALMLVSFGFKHGVPSDLDTVFDVRCLPNPHYEKELRPLTGLDARVKEFVLSDDKSKELVKKFQELLEFLIPMYQAEGKRYLTVGIGCTGGKHRSVSIVEALGERLRQVVPNLRIEHRNKDRE
ncbi:MAG: hypothetical protein RJB13_1367 [Pseudomonadota bacterium]|jgi:UPF0042 nucleotide-binding protein